ncbi:hypothetical protein BVRB_9g209940 [Beta vulgaris subsp. vulgaris]|nr:hypothetical protein BVRB_9g209940 [Beta vulgaris subsp. vulgaris]
MGASNRFRFETHCSFSKWALQIRNPWLETYRRSSKEFEGGTGEGYEKEVERGTKRKRRGVQEKGAKRKRRGGTKRQRRNILKVFFGATVRGKREK